MPLARTILAAIIAGAVALLPVAGNAMSTMMAPAMDAPMAMTASAPMEDCCPDHAKQEQKAVDDCCAMAACGFTVFSFCEPESILLPKAISAEVLAALAGERLPSQTGHPPFRPPRV